MSHFLTGDWMDIFTLWVRELTGVTREKHHARNFFNDES